MFKKGICISALYKETILNSKKLLDIMNKINETKVFNCVEFYFEGSAQDYNNISGLIKKSNLYAVFLPGFAMKRDCIDLGSLDAIERFDAIEKCKKFIDISYTLNAKKMLILSGPKPENNNDKYEVADNFIKSMEIVLDYAKKHANEYVLDITLEFFNDKGEPYLAVGDIDLVDYICQKLFKNHNNFCITYDTSHVKQLGEDIYNVYLRLKPYIRHIHLANCVTKYPDSHLFGDKHPLFNIEDGDFTDDDMAEFLRYVKKEDMSKIIEVCSYEVITPMEESSDMYYEKIIKSASIVLADT